MPKPVTLRRFLFLTKQGLLLRCPDCGGGELLKSWWSLKPTCPRCGFALDRGEPDFWIGGYAVNLVVSELLATFIVILVAAATWPDVPWRLVQVLAVTLAIALPILFFPVSRVLWLAWDYCFRPVRD